VAKGSGAATFAVAGVVSIGHAQPGNTGGIRVTGMPALP
jgi:hypothetical protein